jgi:hypothetical protein
VYKKNHIVRNAQCEACCLKQRWRGLYDWMVFYGRKYSISFLEEVIMEAQDKTGVGQKSTSGFISYALEMGQQKNNFCDRDGYCTVEDYPEEPACAFYARYNDTGFCAFSAWQGQCLSPKALVAARISMRVSPELSWPDTAKESSRNTPV